MKLVTFVKSGEERLGLLAGDDVIDPLLASGSRDMFGTALAFIKSGEALPTAKSVEAVERRRFKSGPAPRVAAAVSEQTVCRSEWSAL